ncbi:MAG: hypothetical protein PHP08_00175 [Candidatus Dojkabacteria bacterium]|nr:hypothetical protein [Candidatus Dojkabacteria bacterium]
MPTVGVSKEVYKLLCDKQVELISKRKTTISMTQMMNEIIEKGMPLVN